MIPAQRFMAVAVLVCVLCAGTSCDWNKVERDRDNYIRDGHAAEVKARYADALAAYQMARSLTEKLALGEYKDSGEWVSIVTNIAQVHGKLGDWETAERVLKDALRMDFEGKSVLLQRLAQIRVKKKGSTEEKTDKLLKEDSKK